LKKKIIVGASIAGGVIAAIVIAIVVALALAGVGAKKGYDYWVANRGNLGAANTSPLYDKGNNEGNNPFFDPRRTTKV